MKSIYGDNSLRLRAQKLAARPKCELEWRAGDLGEPHACVKFDGHLGAHKCWCSAERGRAGGRLQAKEKR